MAITFTSDFDGAFFGYQSVQQFATDRNLKSSDVARLGSFSWKTIVRPGDTVFGGERAEVVRFMDSGGNAINETATSGTQYYAVPIYLPTGWVSPELGALGQWGTIFQLHSPNSYGTSASFDLDTAPDFAIELRGGSSTATVSYSRTVLGPLVLGQWIDFLFEINFSLSATGSVRCWRRDNMVGSLELVASITGSNLQATATTPGDHYWKTGLYRSNTSFSNTLYHGTITRASTFDEARLSSFGPDIDTRIPYTSGHGGLGDWRMVRQNSRRRKAQWGKRG